MHTRNLRKVGGSVMLAVPPVILDILHLGPGATVGLVVDGGRLIAAISISSRSIRPRATPVVVPITTGGNFARTAGFTVSLTGAGTRTEGVVRCDQPRLLDLVSRGGRKLETVPAAIIDEVLPSSRRCLIAGDRMFSVRVVTGGHTRRDSPSNRIRRAPASARPRGGRGRRLPAPP
jgi:mRNA interferase ChpB